MNFNYQKYYLEQIKKQQKSILIWFRQSGKSEVIVEILAHYLISNFNKCIYVYTNNKQSSKKLNRKLHLKLNSHSKKYYPNNNIVKFFNSLSYENYRGFKIIDFFIYDNFEYARNLDIMDDMINKFKPKILLTTSQFNTEVVTYFDREADYYLSVVSASSVLLHNEIIDIKNAIGPGYFNISHEYGNIEELYSGLGIKKDIKLIDVWGLKIQRRKKLEEILKKIEQEKK